MRQLLSLVIGAWRRAAWESDRRSINYARHQSITDTQMWIIILSSINLAAQWKFCENPNPTLKVDADEIFNLIDGGLQ